AARLAVVELVTWFTWAGVTYVIGEKIFQGEATWGELLRTLGFAKAPGVLYVFGIVPLLGWGVSAVVGVWMLVTAFVAIRQALDIGNGKTFLTVLVGGGVYNVLQFFLPI
ncbi:MAG: YIP1 family protein, partial [Longimicrobiales bacterium]